MLKAYTSEQLENIQPGETFIYYEGYLPLCGGDSMALTLRDKAWEMYERGLAVLTQKNVAPGAVHGSFEYYITGVKLGTIRRFTPAQRALERRTHVSSPRNIVVHKAAK